MTKFTELLTYLTSTKYGINQEHTQNSFMAHALTRLVLNVYFTEKQATKSASTNLSL